MIQIRNVPEEFHRKVKARAALAGLSMSEFIMRELDKVLKKPTRAEVLAQIRALGPIEDGPSGAELIREGREEREAELDRDR